MVDSVIDPIRVPTITLSQAEMEEIEQLMAAGALAPDFLDRYHEAVEKNVFGFDHKKDEQGNPVEQGIGSAANQTANSINAYIKYAKYEPGYVKEEYEKSLARMRAELTACNKQRAAMRAKKGRP